MKYYSPSTQGFYDKDVHDIIPEDSVEITDEYWESLLGNEIAFDGEKPIIKVYTEEELAQQELNTKLSEAKQYLSSTDFYFTVDKYATLTDDRKFELETARANARLIINNGGIQ